MDNIKDILNAHGGAVYPSITFRKIVFFPGDKVPLAVEGEESVQTLRKALDADKKIIIIFQKNGESGSVGLLANILQSWSIASFMMGLFTEGIARVKIRRTFVEEGIQKTEIEEIENVRGDEEDLEALSRNVHDQLKRLVQVRGVIPLTLAEDMQKEYLSPERISDAAISVLKLSFKDRLGLLETIDVSKRLEKVGKELAKEIRIVETEKMIHEKMAKEMDKEKRDVLLRQQLKVIEKELGIGEEEEGYADLEKKIGKTRLPVAVAKRALKELSRLRGMYAGNPEASYIRTYIDWILEIPWIRKKGGEIDFKKAEKVLDEDHYGLDKVKERVVEFLAVQKLTKGKSHGNILCFVGPPGTGKTSVGKSIARALGREFVRISLGGLRDEAEIRGHRRTYVGALPGRIIQGMKMAGTKNPVFMLDEIDKLNANFLGDPGAALLEVLDPEQNNSFSDNFIELPYDLSEVLFITTANVLDTIAPALHDRLEIIEFPGYTTDEKFHIAEKYLIPRVLKEHGLDSGNLEFEDSSVSMIIGRYTREAGVRELERKLKEVARKIAKKIVESGGKKKTAVISSKNLSDFIGAEEFEITMKEERDEIGVSTGLAWTMAGGEIIFVEAVAMPGRGELILTGRLGAIMKESVRAALSYVRSRSKDWKISPALYAKTDIHVHVPSGAVPKDGPSAGIAIVVALASVMTKRKVRKEVALTGESTLSGKVLKIGGVKEKVLAAHRAGVEVVVMPKENEKNLIDVPESVRKKLKFKFVEHMDEVLKIALK